MRLCIKKARHEQSGLPVEAQAALIISERIRHWMRIMQTSYFSAGLVRGKAVAARFVLGLETTAPLEWPADDR